MIADLSQQKRAFKTIPCQISPLLIRGEPERAPNTRGTGSGFICIYIYMFVG